MTGRYLRWFTSPASGSTKPEACALRWQINGSESHVVTAGRGKFKLTLRNSFQLFLDTRLPRVKPRLGSFESKKRDPHDGSGTLGLVVVH